MHDEEPRLIMGDRADGDDSVANGPGDAAHVTGDIVVGVDGSKESFAALRWALGEAGVSGQPVNAVFGWTASWDMGDQPDNGEGWDRMRERISAKLRAWVDDVCSTLPRKPDDIALTSVRASGAVALLQIGADAQQIVVGRRTMGRVMRWFSGSTSSTLTSESVVPVTVVRMSEPDEDDVKQGIAKALGDERHGVNLGQDAGATGASHHDRLIVAGVDASPSNSSILRFAAREARLHGQPLHVIFCWQIKDLGVVPGYERAVAPMDVNQRHAEHILDKVIERADLGPDLDVRPHAFHIRADHGLVNASKYAAHLILGSRGLTGLDAHFLGSVSNRVVEFAECTVTVVH